MFLSATIFILIQSPRIISLQVRSQSDQISYSSPIGGVKTIYQNRRKKDDVTLSHVLLETTDFWTSLAEVKVDIATSRWRLNDVCQKPYSNFLKSAIGELNFVKTFKEIARKVSPCKIVSPIGCFADMNLVYSKFGWWESSIDWINEKMYADFPPDTFGEDPQGNLLEVLTIWTDRMTNYTKQNYPKVEKDVAKMTSDWLEYMSSTIGRKPWAEPAARLGLTTWIPVESHLNVCQIIQEFNKENESREEKWRITGRFLPKERIECEREDEEGFLRWAKTQEGIEFMKEKGNWTVDENPCLLKVLHGNSSASIPSSIFLMSAEELKITAEESNSNITLTEAENILKMIWKETRGKTEKWEGLTSEFALGSRENWDNDELKLVGIQKLILVLVPVLLSAAFLLWRSRFLQCTFWFMFRCLFTLAFVAKWAPEYIILGRGASTLFLVYVYMNFLATTLIARFKVKTTFVMDGFEERRPRQYLLIFAIFFPIPLFLSFFLVWQILALIVFCSLVLGILVEVLFTSSSYLSAWRFDRESHNLKPPMPMVNQSENLAALPPEMQEAFIQQFILQTADRDHFWALNHSIGLIKVISQYCSDLIWKTGNRLHEELKSSFLKAVILVVSSMLLAISVTLLAAVSPSWLAEREFQDTVMFNEDVHVALDRESIAKWAELKKDLEREDIYEVDNYNSLLEPFEAENRTTNGTEFKKTHLKFTLSSESTAGLLRRIEMLKRLENDKTDVESQSITFSRVLNSSRNGMLLGILISTLIGFIILLVISQKIVFSIVIPLACSVTVLEAYALAWIFSITQFSSSQTIPFAAFALTWTMSLWHCATGFRWQPHRNMHNVTKEDAFITSIRSFVVFFIGYTAYRMILAIVEGDLNVRLVQFDTSLLLAGFNAHLAVPGLLNLLPEYSIQMPTSSPTITDVELQEMKKDLSPMTSMRALSRGQGSDDNFKRVPATSSKSSIYSSHEDVTMSDEDEEVLEAARQWRLNEKAKNRPSTSAIRVPEFMEKFFAGKEERERLQATTSAAKDVELIPLVMTRAQYEKELQALGMEPPEVQPLPPVMEQIVEEEEEEEEHEEEDEEEEDHQTQLDRDVQIVIEIIGSDGKRTNEDDDFEGFGGADL